VPEQWLYTQKFGEGSWIETGKLAFFVFFAGQPAGRLGTAMGTRQAVGAHTGTGRQCTDAVETAVGADGPARILQMRTGSGGLWQAKSRMGLPT